MSAWTEPGAVADRLRRRWQRGELLRAYAAGQPWEPFSVAISGPTASDVGGDLTAVRSWVARWEKATSPSRPIRMETANVGGRLVGRNELPHRAWVDGYAEAFALLGVRADVEEYERLLAETVDPALVDWAKVNPIRVLAARDEWRRLVATVDWVANHDTTGRFLRQIDAPGVDTKFVESSRRLLADLLDAALSPDRVDPSIPVARFANRYGFATKPDYVRWRALDSRLRTSGFSELSVRVGEFAAAPPPASRVIVVENEITYLALPRCVDAIAIFGSGYGAGRLSELSWLAERDVVYWGDIDTHGFTILDQVRARFPHVRSTLMDRETLELHADHWTCEPKQHVAELCHLDMGESELYRGLVDGVHGERVRLEQERIRFSRVEAALATLGWRSVRKGSDL